MEKDNKHVKNSNNETCTSPTLETNTSILDFKSPKIKHIKEIKLFDFELKKSKRQQTTQLKLNLNNIIDNKASTTKQGIISDAHIQTVSHMSCDQQDGSINLPNNTTVAFVCPLCFKNYKDNNSRIFHMKNCATQNKISMKKLLQAMELQERQAAERVSLGLPGAPILQNKKQTSIRKMAIDQDSQLQLALALSKSLYEVEEIKNNNQTEQNFVPASTKHSIENITNRIQRKRKQNIISVLKIRSQEERDRLLTEKIAEILVDSETLIQRQQEAKNENESRIKDNLKSYVLINLLNFDNHLWNAATLQSNQTDFFVKDLSPYIMPSEQKQFMENINDSNVMMKSQQKGKSAVTYDSCFDKEESSNISHKMDVKLFMNIKKENMKKSCINNLMTDWGNALNNSSCSDVIIFVNGDKQIWVHKLVFHVRCPNILLDIIPNESTVYSVKEKICWTNVEYYIALAFLEFIYCGIIEKYPISSNDNIAISSLGCLARRYKVKELFSYLRHIYVVSRYNTSMDNEFELDEKDIQEINYTNNEQNELTSIPNRDNNAVKCSNQDTFDTTNVIDNQFLKTNVLSPDKCTLPGSLIDRENSMSPDIFDDIDNITLNHSDNTKFIHIENSNINVEYDLSCTNQQNLKNIATNLLSTPSQTNKSRNFTDKSMSMETIITETTEQISDITASKINPKSDLTLFIEEIKKENAKSDSEVDSEMSSPSKLFIKNKMNPFKKAKYTQSSIVLDRIDKNEHSSPKFVKKFSNLSKFERDIQIYANENPQLCNITIDENLKFTRPVNYNCRDWPSPTREVISSIGCNEKIIESVQENNVSMTTSYSSSSEMDTDDANDSMYTKYKRKNVNNSIAIYRFALKGYKNNTTEIEMDKQETNEIITSDHTSNFSSLTRYTHNDTNHTRNDNLDTKLLSDINRHGNSSIIQVEKNTSNSEFSNETQIYNVLGDNNFQSTEYSKLPELNNWNSDKLNVTCNSNNLKTQSNSNETFNDDCSNILYSDSSELHDVEKQYSNPLKKKRKKKSPIYSNPILISSSSDIDFNSEDNDDFRKSDNEHVMGSKTQEFDHELQYFFPDITSFSNVKIENKEKNVALENNPLQIYRKNKTLRKRSRSEGSLQNNYSIEKDCKIYEFDSISLNKGWSRINDYKSNSTNRLLTITESFDISLPNYGVMNTPELHKEMKKYGLKIQNRKKAIKLLTYIYNELHPIISSYKDEEPQKKRQESHTSKNSRDYTKKRKTTVANASTKNIITLINCVSIPEAFSKLLRFNENIHGNILRYEPLNIELIHNMLKTGGFKCNVKALVDFLDEQCITFHSSKSRKLYG